MYPEELKYNEEHTWLKLEPGNKGRIGITFYAQKQLREVVFVELPEVGAQVQYMEPFGVIESVKATNDLYSPVNGTVLEVNPAVPEQPNIVNQDPYGSGWMILVELSSPSELDALISVRQYREFVGDR